jgi:orotate phosphoribosyltransferase
MTALFQQGYFKLSSGAFSNLKIECDALDLAPENWETLAMLIRTLAHPFNEVIGVPTGGLRLSQHLVNYAVPSAPGRLIVDDVWTTGGSVRKFWQPGDQVFVAFQRGPIPLSLDHRNEMDVQSLFTLHRSLWTYQP